MASSTYTTKQGDMWDSIAYKVYGDEYQTAALMDANLDYIDTIIFSAGVTLTIPELDSTETTNTPPWLTS